MEGREVGKSMRNTKAKQMQSRTSILHNGFAFCRHATCTWTTPPTHVIARPDTYCCRLAVLTSWSWPVCVFRAFGDR